MQRVVVDLVGLGQLHHLAQVHHGDAVGDVAHHQQVVGDEEVGQAQLLLEVVKHVDDLRLNGHVQRGDGLVADDELGIDRQCAGDADALALATGKLVGVAGGVLAVQADVAHQLQNALLTLLLAGVELVHVQRLTDDVGDRHAGIQRGVGILKDHGGLLAELLDVLLALDGLAVEDHLSGGGLVQVQNRAAHGGLAAAGLAHQAQRLALVDGEGDVIHGLEGLGAEEAHVDIEVFLEVLDLNERAILVFRHCPHPLPG